MRASGNPDSRYWWPRTIAINQKVISKILESAGHRPILVGNGEQALDALARESFDLVILDMQMPVVSGLEVVKIHRFTGPKESSVRFLILTANATTEAMNECREAGVDAFLTKPIEPAKLLDQIDRLAPRGRWRKSIPDKAAANISRHTHRFQSGGTCPERCHARQP